MDRIINIKVGGYHLSKDSNLAGVCGSGNAVSLCVTFDAVWKAYAKKIVFWNARGLNPVERILTVDLLRETTDEADVYMVPIPAEPLEFSGNMTFVIEGYTGGNTEGKRVRCVPGELEVEEAPVVAGEPADILPDKAEQLQLQIEGIKKTIQDAINATEAVKNMSASVEGIELDEDVFVEKTIQNDVVNLHFGLPVNGAKKDLSNVTEETLRGRVYKIVEAISEDGLNYTATVEGVTELYDGLMIRIKPNMDIAASGAAKTLNVNGLGVKSMAKASWLTGTPSTSDKVWMLRSGIYDLVYNKDWETWICTTVTGLTIVNNCNSPSPDMALSANQGRVLNGQISTLRGDTSKLDAKITALEEGALFSNKKTTLTVPAGGSVNYTVFWSDGLKALKFSTSLEGYTPDMQMAEHYGIDLHSPNGWTCGWVYSGETLDMVKDFFNGNEAVEGYGFEKNEDNTIAVCNHATEDAIVYIEEINLNKDYTDTFALKDALDSKAEAADVKADIADLRSEVNSGLAEKADNVNLKRLDNGILTENTTLTIPANSTVNWVMLWDREKVPVVRLSTDSVAAISPTAEYSGVRLAVASHDNTINHIVYGRDPLEPYKSVEDEYAQYYYITVGAENTFKIQNHTSSEVTVNIEVGSVSNIDKRLTALEDAGIEKNKEITLPGGGGDATYSTIFDAKRVVKVYAEPSNANILINIQGDSSYQLFLNSYNTSATNKIDLITKSIGAPIIDGIAEGDTLSWQFINTSNDEATIFIEDEKSLETVVVSPNGKRFMITVSDDGTLSAEAL